MCMRMRHFRIELRLCVFGFVFPVVAACAMSAVIAQLHGLEPGQTVSFDYCRGRWVNPFFLGKTYAGKNLCKFGHEGGWHGDWVLNNELDEVRAKLLTIN